MPHLPRNRHEWIVSAFVAGKLTIEEASALLSEQPRRMCDMAKCEHPAVGTLNNQQWYCADHLLELIPHESKDNTHV